MARSARSPSWPDEAPTETVWSIFAFEDEAAESREKRAATTYFEGFFLLILAGAAATGILSEVLRLAQASELMYLTYFIHLSLVFMLFLYAPYSKFVHFLYRTVTLAIARDGQSIAVRPAGA